jgi:hypothetical protein
MMMSLYRFCRKALVVASFLLLAACASSGQMPSTVLIPIAVPAAVPMLPPEPYLPIEALKPNSPPDVVLKSYAASVLLLKGWGASLLTLHLQDK